MHRLATMSLNNRSFIALVCVVVSILGAMAMTTLRQELIPSVTLPQIQVVTTAPGSSPEQVRGRISEPIEDAVRGLENVESTSSTSQSSMSMVTVELTYGTDIARSSNQIEAALNRIEDSLPESADPQVISGGTGDIPAAILSVSSDLSPAELADRLDASVVPELRRVDGVSGVIVAGAPEQIIRITPDEDELEERGMTVDTIAEALDANGLSVPGGTVTDDDRTLDVSIGRTMGAIEDLEQMVLMPPADDQAQANAPPADGQPQDPAAQDPNAQDPTGAAAAETQPGTAPAEVTRLSDVATVEKTEQDATSISRTNGRESLVMIVNATVDGNVVDISEDVTKVLDEQLPSVGGDATSDIVFDQAPFIEESILALAEEGLLGLVFAIAVILIFLRAVRPTIVTAISIPLSLLMAFVGMLVSGYTLNMLTLAALTISIGRVVDDSIVVIENIMRHLTYGKTRARAIIDAVGEVAGAITAATLATVIVFLPVAVVSGMAGELFRPFSLTVALAMLASLIVSLTIVPVLAYWFLRAPKAARDLDPEDEQAVTAVREAAEEKEERGLLNRSYLGTLAWTLRHRILTVLLAAAVMGGTVALIPLMKVNFLGDTGQNIAAYTQTLPVGTSLEESSAKAADAEEALQAIDGVQTVQTTIGGSQFGFGGTSNEITYQVTTDPDADQEALSTEMLDALTALPEAGEIEDAMASGGGIVGGNTVDVLVTGPTPEARQEAVDAILAELDPLPDTVSEVSSDLEGEQPTAVITVDREKTAQRGLPEEAVVGLVARQMFPGAIGTITIGDSELDIYVQQGERPETYEELQDLEILGFPLTDVANIDEVLERPTILTRDARETATITVTPSTDDVQAATADVRAAIDAAELPDGAQTSIGGTAADIEETFGQLYIALAAAVMLTYVLLVWIFKSLKQPLVLLVSIPFAATGSFGLLILTGVPLGLPSMIGLLMLIGIVVTNAIVLIDLVNQYRRRGMGLDEALLAGAQKRLRPILMTSAATIFALLPMAFGITGNGGFIAQPLAVVVIGGLVTSTLLTLVIVPVLYRITEGPGEKRRLREEERTARLRRDREARQAQEREQARREEQARAAQSRTADGTRRPVETTGTDASVGTSDSPRSQRPRRRTLRERGGLLGILRSRRS